MKGVLVVDDEALVRDTLTAILAASGYDVIQAKDGLDGLLKYQASRAKISLVIIDIKMPMMDGIMLCSVIKEADPLTKVILISGYVDQPLSEAKADAFLPKPFESKALLDMIRQVLAA